MEEIEILRRDHVRVTNATLRIGDTTYPIRNITAVSVGRTKSPLALPLVLAAIGMICSLTSILWAVVFFALAALVAYVTRGQPALVLSTAGNNVNALVSRDEGLILDVANALNKAIVRQHH
jgi:hypothetical protein